LQSLPFREHHEGLIREEMMKAFLAILIVALAVPAVAYAAGEGQTKGKKPHKICKNVVRTGSHLDERLCLTVDQWLARAERDAEKAEEMALQHKEAGAVSGTVPGLSPH
jgi:hypothetical protein